MYTEKEANILYFFVVIYVTKSWSAIITKKSGRLQQWKAVERTL